MNQKTVQKTILCLFILIGQHLSAQDDVIVEEKNASVEKSIFGVQIGVLGVWAHHEARLSNRIALRSEVGLDTGLWWGDFYDKAGFVAAPVFTVEPRWYYNINKRKNKNRRIDGNSGNFISLKTSYHPDWFVISNYQNIRIISDISFIPTWGIRRNIGQKLNFETGLGIGYWSVINNKKYLLFNNDGVAINLHLRLGYKF